MRLQIPKALTKPLSAEEEVAIFLRAKGGDTQARDRLILANVGMVHRIVMRYHTRTGVSFEDLFQEAFVGLLIAFGRFDPSFNWRFLSYAYFWIERMCIQFCALSRGPYVIRHPGRRMYEKAVVEGASKRKLAKIAKQNKISKRTRKMIELHARRADDNQTFFSFDGEDASPDAYIENFIDGGELPDANLWRLDAIAACERLLQPREAEVIARRYLADRPATFVEVGQAMGGISKQRVDQLEKRAIKRLQAGVGR